MKKIYKIFFAVILGLFFGGCTLKTTISPSYDFDQMRRIGIMSFSDSQAAIQGVENLFAKYLIEAGYKVVERARLESILQEHNISVTGYLSPETTREIGRILGVDVLLIGEVSTYTPSRTELAMTASRRTEARPVVQQDVMRMPDGSYVGYMRPVGTRVTQSSDVRPTQYTINAQVGIIAKLVDVETAEIVWIGSDEESAARALDAADYIARSLVKSFNREVAKRQKVK